MSLPDYDPRGNKDVGDILEPTYPGSLEELMEVFVDWVRWHRQREPVNPGDPFTKFATRGWLVQQGVVSEAQVLGDDTDETADDTGAIEDRMVVVYAREMHPATTAGCSALTILELSSTKPTIATLNFDATTQEYAHVALLMPPGWPGGSFTYRVYWSHTSGGSGFGVAWNLAGNSCENDETISAVFDSGTTVTDTGGTADDMYITDESAATPIQGTLAKAGDLVFLRLSRVPSHASDTLNIDARLHAIRFNLNEAQVEDAGVVEHDPDWASVSLLVQGGADADTTVTDLAYGATQTFTSGEAEFDDSQTIFGANMIKGIVTAPIVTPFSASDGRFERASGEAFTIEAWCRWNSSQNSSVVGPIWEWRTASASFVRIKYYLNTGVVRLGVGIDPDVTLATPSADVNHFIQCVISTGNTIEIFIDGTSIYSAAFTYATGTGTLKFSVCGSLSSSTSTPNAYWVGPVRVTKGVARANDVPTALFPTS